MVQLHRNRKGFYYLILKRKGRTVWQTPTNEYNRRQSALNALFTAYDMFCGEDETVVRNAISYADHTVNGEQVTKTAKRRVRKK